MSALHYNQKRFSKIPIQTNVRAGPGRASDKCPGRAGPGGSGSRVAGCGSLNSPGAACRGARAGDHPRTRRAWWYAHKQVCNKGRGPPTQGQPTAVTGRREARTRALAARLQSGRD